MSQSGAGWHPAADCESASLELVLPRKRPIANRPQVFNLPHFGSLMFLDVRRSESKSRRGRPAGPREWALTLLEAC
jgi:hypothetical protein